ncbi:kinase-like protein [Xylariaceae sp. FL0662B]|nr:kinase-like protein [Xylariaceae sp. FL0662B]
MSSMDASSDFETALALVHGAGFTHPDGELLTTFLQDSVDQDQAARCLLHMCSLSGNNAAGLSSVLSCWKSLVESFIQHRSCRPLCDKGIVRDITSRDEVCYLTGRQGSWIDPLIVTHIFPPTSMDFDPTQKEMLAAFLSSSHEEWLESYFSAVESRQRMPPNLWLVKKSAADAFVKGFFEVTVESHGVGPPPPLLQSFCAHSSSASDHRPVNSSRVSHADIASPDPFALEILSRFAEATRWLHLAQRIREADSSRSIPASALTSRPTSWLFSMRTTCCDFLLASWLMVPPSVRRRIYGPSSSFKVRRLPFGMYLKTSSNEWLASLSNKYETLGLLRRQTDVPVPKPLDLISQAEDCYLLTSRQPGRLVGVCIGMLSDKQLRYLVYELQHCLNMLRGLPRDPDLQGKITNTVGEACYDARINAAVPYDETRGDFIGPFQTEHEFNETLRNPHIPDTVHRSGHKIVFTHGDLNMRNILVDGKSGRLSGIVDWETAGWFPDYWDYTKAHYTTKLKWRWRQSVIEPTFRDFGDFSEDLDIEKKLWWYCW